MISDIRLQHFRSYSDAVFEFTPAVNIIVGPNGSGKTNLLEALLVLSRGSSYRVHDAELVQYDQEWSRLDAHIDGDVRTVKIVNRPMPSKTYEIDGRTYRRLVPAKVIPLVIFEPDHLAMLSGSPELRRSYLDDLLEQTEPGYGKLRRDYRRTLTQRNSLLKQHGMAAASQIFPWNVRLSELAGAIAAQRFGIIDMLSASAGELYSSLADKTTAVQLQYLSKFPAAHYASALLRALEQYFELDVMRGFTGNGPHREDFSITLSGHDAQVSASRGETRTAVLMLKVMELRLIEQLRGVSPLLLLDDVFSELDGARRQALTTYLQDYQTFITTTDADVVVQHFMDRCSIVPLGTLD